MSCLKNVIFFFFFFFLAFNTSALLSLLLTKLVFGSAPQCGGRGGLPTRALPEGVGGTHKSISWGGPTRAFLGGDPQEHFLKFQCQTILGTVENEYDENIDTLLFVLLNSIPISVLSINSILLQQLKPEHLQLWACCCKGQTNKKSCIC